MNATIQIIIISIIPYIFSFFYIQMKEFMQGCYDNLKELAPMCDETEQGRFHQCLTQPPQMTVRNCCYLFSPLKRIITRIASHLSTICSACKITLLFFHRIIPILVLRKYVHLKKYFQL